MFVCHWAMSVLMVLIQVAVHQLCSIIHVCDIFTAKESIQGQFLVSVIEQEVIISEHLEK